MDKTLALLRAGFTADEVRSMVKTLVADPMAVPSGPSAPTPISVSPANPIVPPPTISSAAALTSAPAPPPTATGLTPMAAMAAAVASAPKSDERLASRARFLEWRAQRVRTAVNDDLVDLESMCAAFLIVRGYGFVGPEGGGR